MQHEPLTPDNTADDPPNRWTPPTEPEHHFLESDDGARLHYAEWAAPSNAPVLIMIHGRRAHARWFDPVAAELSPRWRCVALDMRAHGESGTTPDSPGGFERHAADLALFFKRFGGSKRYLLAHSMAGRVTLLAIQNFELEPDLLILADTPLTLRPHHFRPEPPFRNKNYPTREEAVSRFRLQPDGTSADPMLLRYVAGHALRQNDDGTWSWKFDDVATSRVPGMKIPDWHDMRMEEIGCPTLVIHGEHSTLVDAEDAQQIAARFPRGTAKTLNGAHHHLMLDRPAEFNAAVREFIEKNS